jgi:hypothetical protein
MKKGTLQTHMHAVPFYLCIQDMRDASRKLWQQYDTHGDFYFFLHSQKLISIIGSDLQSDMIAMQ